MEQFLVLSQGAGRGSDSTMSFPDRITLHTGTSSQGWGASPQPVEEAKHVTRSTLMTPSKSTSTTPET